MIDRLCQGQVAAGLAILVLLTAVACSGQPPAPQVGPEPNFPDDGQLWISIEVLKAEYDRQSDFILADARPRSEYAKHHITGAVSVPFNEVEQMLDQLPRDKWIVFY